MKKAQLERRPRGLAKAHDATITKRQGNHEIWIIDGLSVPIPRHREINELTAKGILKGVEEHLKGDTE